VRDCAPRGVPPGKPWYFDVLTDIMISDILISGIMISGILNPSPPGHCGAAKATGQTGAADCVRSRE